MWGFQRLRILHNRFLIKPQITSLRYPLLPDGRRYRTILGLGEKEKLVICVGESSDYI